MTLWVTTVRSSCSVLSELCDEICLGRSSTSLVSPVSISTFQRKKRVSYNTHSFWLRSVINHAYTSASDEDCRARWVKAHEVWRIATSLLFRRNYAVHQVLKAGTWWSQSTFTSFYLFTHRHFDTFFIGPVVVAQQVV